MADLAALIERLENLEAPDRALDAEIACEIRYPDLRPAHPDDHQEHQRGYPPSPGDIWCPTGFLMAPAYTSSMDDAASLIPPDHDWSLFSDNGENLAGCMPASEQGCDLSNCRGATPAIALSIAAIKARIELQNIRKEVSEHGQHLSEIENTKTTG